MGNDEKYEQLVHEICRRVGYFGNLISMSKSGYRERNPDHLVVFNSNIIAGDGTKIWFGDIDITNSGEVLKSLADTFETTLYVLHEMDGRFDNEDNPKISNYVIKFNPNNTYELSSYLSERDHGYAINF